MAIEVGVPRSRRAVLAAALGGLAASAAHAFGRPTAALATDGQPVVQGADNSGSASTLVRSNTTTALQGLADAASGGAYGVRGRSNSTGGAGVVGQVIAATGTNYGVRGISGSNGGVGVRGEAPLLGVEGVTLAANQGIGVSGTSSGNGGIGVKGVAKDAVNGTGVSAEGATLGVYAVAEAVGGFGVTGVAFNDGQTVGTKGIVYSANGIGVFGHALQSTATSARGVVGRAETGTGVHGWVSGGPLPPTGTPHTGVHGECHIDANSNGVYGASNAGVGVRATSTSGIGLLAAAANTASAAALKVDGRAVFSRSGKAKVLSGHASVVVSGIPLTSSSLVLATIQGSGASGVYVRNVAVSVGSSLFTIRLSKAVAADTNVAWFIVN
jgi:hypothetical protein